MGSITHENFLTTKYFQTTVYLAPPTCSVNEPALTPCLLIHFNDKYTHIAMLTVCTNLGFYDKVAETEALCVTHVEAERKFNK